MIGVSIAFVPMLQAFGGTESQTAFQKAVTILSVIAAATMMLIFFSTKERIQPATKTITMKQSFSALLKNKPLMLIIISMIISNSLMTVMQTVLVFFAKYNLGDPNIVSMLTIVMFIPLVIGTAITGTLSKKFGKKQTLIFITLFRAVALMAMYFTGYSNLVLVYVFYGLNGLFLGITTVLMTSMLADCIVYSEWSTGIRSDGLSFSMRTFMAKLASAIGGGLSALLLAVYGYQAGTEVSVFTMNGIYQMISLFPAIAAVIGVIPLFFYSISADKLKAMTKQIEERAQRTEAAVE
jgi:Na+/melibiose symporter-like transporter